MKIIEVFLMSFSLPSDSKILERRITIAWLITDQHRLATILHPKLKNFERCPDEKEKSLDALKAEFKKYQSNNSLSNMKLLTSIPASSESASTSRSTTTTLKRKNILSQCFDSKLQMTCKPPNIYQEIDDYLIDNSSQAYADDENADDIDILSFWKDKQHSFPVLSSIAKQVCAIPASNTVIERLFSASKNVVTEKRTRLGSEKINELLFLQKNLIILKNLVDNNSRKRTISMSSTTASSCEESTCTIPKQQRLEVDTSFSDSDDAEIFLD